MSVWVIRNPAAGRAEEASGEWRAALEEIPGARVVETGASGDAERAAARALEEGVEVVVAAGGDGTVNGVVNGLAADPGRCVLGVIPLGTANDFARSIGIPADPVRAVALLRSGNARAVDAVRVEAGVPGAPGRRSGTESEAVERSSRRWMVNVAVGGVAGRIGERVDAERKRRWGSLAYLRTAAEELPDLPAYDLRAELDGETVETEVHHVIVANGRRAGGNLPVAPRALLDDGAVDVVLIPALEVPEMLTLAPEILTGRHLEDERVLWGRVGEASFEADPALPFGLDGEPFGRGPVRFRVRPGALRVLCGPREGRALADPT